MSQPKPLHTQALAAIQKYASLGLPANTEVSAQEARINGNIGRAAYDLDRLSYIDFGSDYYLIREAMTWFWDHYLGADGDGFSPYEIDELG